MDKIFQVLVIDDTPANLKVVASVLRANGYGVLVATGGKHGIAMAQAKSPDLILLDIMMPEMDGYEACGILKKDEKTRDIPIIFLTAVNEIYSVVKGFEYGASDYITKPFNPSELLARVKNHIRNRYNEEQVRILSMAVQQSANSIIITDPQGSIVFVNKHFLKTTGYEKNEVIGQNPSIVRSDKHSEEFYKELWDTITAGKEWHGEFRNKKKNEESYWGSATITPIKDEKEKILYYLAIEEDITEKKKMEEELRYFSSTDTMTDTSNRRTGIEVLKSRIESAKQLNQTLTVCFIDLNNLKVVNDTCGHNQGDAYIILVCDNIKTLLRNSDTLVRLGGDEFLVILPNCGMKQAEVIMKRLTDRIDEMNRSERYPFTASVSYGFAEHNPQNKLDYEALIGIADNEMYKHKLICKNALAISHFENPAVSNGKV